jgi:retron-type reverse transcriptase
MDNILLVVIKTIFEPKCENIFHPNSFGFRPNKSVHHALLEVKSLRGITWMIEGDFKGYFEKIDHHTLAKLITERLNPDRTLMGLIWKFFKAGYIAESQWEFKQPIIGPKKGGILSPLMSNLFLTQFDEFLDVLKNKYENIHLARPNTNPEY